MKELTNEIKSTLEVAFPYVWVKGELGSVKLHSSGHRYFSLKEDDCVINAICWRGTILSIALEEGKMVECYAKVTIFGGRSSYQIIAKEIREISSKGYILLKLEELTKKLREEGIFSLKNSEDIVKFPKKIAILTSPTGAVIHDMMHRINGRFPSLHVYFYPINVQGSDSKKSILNGLTKAENSDVDTVILARGGGSLEDLWIFNDEEIVRKVALLKKGIITAIGHETDTTLVDYASNLRAPTPTAAIEFCVPDKEELKKEIIFSYSSTLLFCYEKTSNYSKTIDQLEDTSFIIEGVIENFDQRIDNIILIFSNDIRSRLKKIELDLALVEVKPDLVCCHLDRFCNRIESLYNYSIEFSKIRSSQIASDIEKDENLMIEKEKELKEKVIILSKDNLRINSALEITKLEKQPFSINFIDGSVVVSET